MVSRSQQLDSVHEPLPSNPPLQLTGKKVTGPTTFLNPTQARFSGAPPPQTETNPQQDSSKHVEALPPNVEFKFTTRNKRKGRHKLLVTEASKAGQTLPSSSRRPSSVLRGIRRMFTCFPYWDISWLVSVAFTLGPVVWILNSFFVFLPLRWPFTEFEGEVLYGGGMTAFIGATIFEIGGVLLMLEALNEDRVQSFGWAVEQLYDGEIGHAEFATMRIVPVDASVQARKNDSVWVASRTELVNHYLREVGFLACTILFVSATIFYVSGIVALPWCFKNMTTAERDIFYWTSQVIGGVGFIVSGLLFTIETQKYWWKPSPRSIGWHVGSWNTVGGVGFFLSPCFGYSPEPSAQYMAALATFWGSWAFLFGSLLQWYESLEKHPVEVKEA